MPEWLTVVWLAGIYWLLCSINNKLDRIARLLTKKPITTLEDIQKGQSK